MKINNGFILFRSFLGGNFEVVEIALTVDEANKYCEEHENCGVIDEDEKGLVYIAKKDEYKSKY